MNLDYSQDRWIQTQDAYARWWAGTLSRPLIHLFIKDGRDAGRPEPTLPSYEFTSVYDLTVSAEAVVDRMIYDLERRVFLGDAFPFVIPNFGPGVAAAFSGLALENGKDTVWFHPAEVDELEDVRLELDPENIWLRRIRAIYQELAARGGKMVQLGMTDLGGGLDLVANARGSQDLLLDLYDCPEVIEQKVADAHVHWWRCFENLDALIQQGHQGYTAWTPLYSAQPYYILQCDFSYMLSTEMFDRFALPEIKQSCSKLTNPFFHMDGPGMLNHLDSLLAIPELKGIQWVPGAGQPPVTEWPDVYRKIRAAGKRIQFFTSQDPMGWRSLEVIAEQLGSAEGIMMYGEVPAAEEAQAREMLARFNLV